MTYHRLILTGLLTAFVSTLFLIPTIDIASANCDQWRHREATYRNQLNMRGCDKFKNRRRADCVSIYGQIKTAKANRKRACAQENIVIYGPQVYGGRNITRQQAERLIAPRQRNTGACPPGMRRSEPGKPCHCPPGRNCYSSSGAPADAQTLMNDFLTDGSGFFVGPFAPPW